MRSSHSSVPHPPPPLTSLPSQHISLPTPRSLDRRQRSGQFSSVSSTFLLDRTVAHLGFPPRYSFLPSSLQVWDDYHLSMLVTSSKSWPSLLSPSLPIYPISLSVQGTEVYSAKSFWWWLVSCQIPEWYKAPCILEWLVESNWDRQPESSSKFGWSVQCW